MPIQFASFPPISIIFLLFLVTEIWTGCVLSTQKPKKGVSVRKRVTLASLLRERVTLESLFSQRSNASGRSISSKTNSQQSFQSGKRVSSVRKRVTLASHLRDSSNVSERKRQPWQIGIGALEEPFSAIFQASTQANSGSTRRLQKQHKQTEKWLNQPPYYMNDRNKNNRAKSKTKRHKEITSNSRKPINDKKNYFEV